MAEKRIHNPDKSSSADVSRVFECVVGKCFVVLYVFSFPPSVYVGTLNLIAPIPGPSILTFKVT